MVIYYVLAALLGLFLLSVVIAREVSKNEIER